MSTPTLTRVFATATLALALAASSLSIVQAKGDGISPFVPDAVTHHSMLLHGTRLNYTARAGLIALRDAGEKQTATMFYTAYTLDGANARTRPVTFFYNGGPGSATIWLRMGSFGPVRAVVGNGKMTAPAPFTLVDNQDSLLDKTDMVFVDMPASGFGRILPGADAKKIFGSDNDVKAFSQFIERYLIANRRWNSPKFLFGESYGTPRSAMLVDALQNSGIGINGVVLQSSILNYELASAETYGGSDTDDWQYVFFMPTQAATAWYYHRVPGAPASLTVFMSEVETFAMGEYRHALDQGAKLPPDEYDRIVSKLHHYTGLSEQYIRNANLRVSGQHFIGEFARTEGKTEGIYDARYQLYTVDQAAAEPSEEPSDAAIEAAYVALQNQYLRETLGFQTSLLYRTDAGETIRASGEWDFKHNQETPLNTTPDLTEALTYNPNLRVFSANGYFDSVTPFLATVYELNHLNLQAALQSHISYGFYPSGHMIYLNTDALKNFHDDLESWYTKTLNVGR